MPAIVVLGVNIHIIAQFPALRSRIYGEETSQIAYAGETEHVSIQMHDDPTVMLANLVQATRDDDLSRRLVDIIFQKLGFLLFE